MFPTPGGRCRSGKQRVQSSSAVSLPPIEWTACARHKKGVRPSVITIRPLLMILPSFISGPPNPPNDSNSSKYVGVMFGMLREALLPPLWPQRLTESLYPINHSLLPLASCHFPLVAEVVPISPRVRQMAQGIRWRLFFTQCVSPLSYFPIG